VSDEVAEVKLSKVEKRLVRMRELAGTMPAARMAKEVGIKLGYLYSLSSRHGIKLAMERKKTANAAFEPTAEQIASVRELAGTMPQQEVSKKTGIPLGTLRLMCGIRGISLRYKPSKGVRCDPGSPKHQERVAYIKSVAGTMTGVDLGKELGITAARVFQIARDAGVSLRAKAGERERKDRTPKATEDQLEAASRLLRQAGWTVIRPDPFLDCKREQGVMSL
jgi:hypothetical protein